MSNSAYIVQMRYMKINLLVFNIYKNTYLNFRLLIYKSQLYEIQVNKLFFNKCLLKKEIIKMI